MYQCFVRNDQESAQATAELKLGGRCELFFHFSFGPQTCVVFFVDYICERSKRREKSLNIEEFEKITTKTSLRTLFFFSFLKRLRTLRLIVRSREDVKR